jgi:hypothetical protein
MDKRKPEYAQPGLFPGAQRERVREPGSWSGRGTLLPPAAPLPSASSAPALPDQAEQQPVGPYRRRGPNRCPDCGQRVDVFPLAMNPGFVALVPGEYPSRRVPDEAAVHVSRGHMWEGRDGSSDTRVLHESVCPAGPRPEHPELSEMWRRLRIRAIREGVPGFAA